MTSNRPIRTLKDLRANASSLDLDIPALAKPSAPLYRHGGDRNRLPVGAAADPYSLIYWCQSEGIDPEYALTHAMWCAARDWCKARRARRVRPTLMQAVSFYSAHLAGLTPENPPSELVDAANVIGASWLAAGSPLLNIACGDTQRHIIGLRKVAARRAAKSRPA